VDDGGELDEAVEQALVVGARLQVEPVLSHASWAAWYRPSS